MLCHQKRHEEVVHVASVVHHEHHGGIRIDGSHGRTIGVAQTHPVYETGETLRHTVSQAEIHIGIECRDNFASVLVHTTQEFFLRHRFDTRLLDDRAQHLGIAQQALDEGLPAGQFERRDVDVQAHIDFIDDPTHLAPEIPPHARDQQPFACRQQGHQQHRHEQPQGQGHGCHQAVSWKQPPVSCRQGRGGIQPAWLGAGISADAFSNTAMLSTWAV